jgi:hypothetical protein
MRFNSEELAYLISQWGYQSDVRGRLAGQDRLDVCYNGHWFTVCIWNLGDDGRGDVLQFSAGIKIELQFFEL